MSKRGGYQATAAGAFGAGGEPLTAEECALCGGTGEIETLDRREAACPACVAREKDATITALRAEVADARQAALLEAAEALDAESKRIAAEADHLNRTNPDWHRRYNLACGVQDAATLLRARAATPAPPAPDPRDSRIAQLEAVCEGTIALLERLHEFVAVRQIRAALSVRPPAMPQAADSEDHDEQG